MTGNSPKNGAAKRISVTDAGAVDNMPREVEEAAETIDKGLAKALLDCILKRFLHSIYRWGI